MRVAIKLGGSVITYKDSKKPKVRKDVIENLAYELSKFKPPFILTHGAGSYGHPLVKDWEEGKLKDYKKIHESVETLNNIVLKCLEKYDIRFDCFSPFKTVTYRERFNMGGLWKKGRYSLKMKNVLVTYGDIVPFKNNFRVLSADVSTCFLAKKWNAEKIIWVIDEDGVYTENSELNENARFIKKMGINNHEIKFRKTKIDVTGGLGEKIRQSYKVGIKSQIINGLIKGNLSEALKGNEKIGTLIMPRRF